MRPWHLAAVTLFALAGQGNAQVSQQADTSRLSASLQLTTPSKAAQAEFWAGLEEWQNFGYANARHHFERALALDSSFGLARAFRAEALVQRGYPLPSADMDRAVRDAARASMGEAVLALAWREKSASHDRSTAALLHALMDILPNEPRLASEYVWSLSAYDMNAALEAARAARVKFPAFAQLSPAFSYVLLQTGDTAAALAEASRYTRLDSVRPVAFVYYGRLLQSRGRFAEAEQQYRRSVSLSGPQGEMPYDGPIALAEVMELQGKSAAAVQVMSEALRNTTSARDSARYLQALGGTQLFASDQAGALRSFSEIARLWPSLGKEAGLDPSGFFSALSDAAFGNGRSVTKFLSDGHPRVPGDTVPIEFSLAGVFAYAGEADSAFKYADKLAARASAVPFAGPASHFSRGEVYLRTHRCEKALDEFRQSDSTWIEVQAGIAECQMQLGHRDVALQWRDRALANRDVNLLDPGEIHARVQMARLH